MIAELFIHLVPSSVAGKMEGIGQYNGYVNLPKGHRWYGLDYEKIPVDIHGGLTYSAQMGEYWTIGFDTAHYGDTAEKWDVFTVHAEAVRLLEQCLYL